MRIRRTDRLREARARQARHPPPSGLHRHHSGCRGVTLVEAVIAIVVLGVVLGGGLYALTAYGRLNEAARRQTEAIHQARAALEKLTQMDYRHSWMTPGTYALPDSMPGQYTVNYFPNPNTDTGRKRLHVAVPWIMPGIDAPMHETLTTIISKALHP